MMREGGDSMLTRSSMRSIIDWIQGVMEVGLEEYYYTGFNEGWLWQ